MVVDKKILKFRRCNFATSLLFPFGKSQDFSLGWNLQSGFGEEDFKVCKFIFAICLLLSFGKGCGTSFEQNWISFIQGGFVPSFVEIGPIVQEKKILKFCQCIYAISLSPLRKGCGPLFGQTWAPSPKDALWQVRLVLEKKIFQISSVFFYYFISISPWKRVRPFTLNYLKSFNTNMLFVKCSWNWPTGSGEEDKNVSSFNNNDNNDNKANNDNGQDKLWSKKVTWAFSSDELKNADLNKICTMCSVQWPAPHLWLQFCAGDLKTLVRLLAWQLDIFSFPILFKSFLFSCRLSKGHNQ